MLFRFFELASGHVNESHCSMADGQLRIIGQRQFGFDLGRTQSAPGQEAEGQEGMRFRQIGIEAQGSLEALDRTVEITLSEGVLRLEQPALYFRCAHDLMISSKRSTGWVIFPVTWIPAFPR